MDPFGNGPSSVRPSNGSDQHISALQEAIVDELANAETTGSGREQLVRCELQYQQVVYLWEQLWPEINGMGEENEVDDTPKHDDSQTAGRPSSSAMAGPSGTNGNAGHVEQKPIEIQDDELDEDNQDAPMDPNGIDSPYGGTGLGAIAAANQAG